MSGGNFSMDNHIISQQYFYSNNGDVSSECVFLKDTLYYNVKINHL